MFRLLKLPFVFSVFILFYNLNNHVAAAASSSDNSKQLELDGPQKIGDGYFGDLIWVLLVLVFVIVLLYYTVKFLGNKNKSFLSPKGIRSLGGIGVGSNSSVQVLHISGRIYIIGVGQQVTLLDKETDPEIVAEIIESFSTPTQTNFVSFKDWVSGLRRNKQSHELDADGVEWNQSNTNSFESLLQSKLDKQAERKQQLESLLKNNNE